MKQKLSIAISQREELRKIMHLAEDVFYEVESIQAGAVYDYLLEQMTKADKEIEALRELSQLTHY